MEHFYCLVNGMKDMVHLRLASFEIMQHYIEHKFVFEAYTLTGIKVHVNGANVSMIMTKEEYDKYCRL